MFVLHELRGLDKEIIHYELDTLVNIDVWKFPNFCTGKTVAWSPSAQNLRSHYTLNKVPILSKLQTCLQLRLLTDIRLCPSSDSPTESVTEVKVE